MIGYNGWFYHFLDMKTGLRHLAFNTELSSIDTALLLAGILDAKQYFNGTNSERDRDSDPWRTRSSTGWIGTGWRGNECAFDGLEARLGFHSRPMDWLQRGDDPLLPGSGAATNPLPASAWDRGPAAINGPPIMVQSLVPFAPCSVTSIPTAGSIFAISRTLT